VLEEILSETYGVMIYQEQVMAIANRFAGLTMAEADFLRKAMSKKKPEVMAEQKARFVDGAVGKGVAKKTAAEVWDQIEKFAGYGFNKSHAVCYAMLAYQTAYLKAHHPVEFMAATMSSEIGNIDRLRTLVDECRRMGAEILPPSVNLSGHGFTVDAGGRIVYALSAIRNVGEGPAAEIVSEREESGQYASLFDLCSRVASGALNRRVLESLGGAGALDCLDASRARLLAGLDAALEYASRAKMLRDAGQMSLFCEQSSYEGGSSEPCLPEAPDLSSTARLNLEKALLGFYFSGHPLDDYSETVATFGNAEPGEDLPQAGRKLRMAGIVAVRREIPTARGNMAFVTLEGRSGSTEVIIFSEPLQRHASLLEPGTFVLCEGEVVDRRDERKLSVSCVYTIEKVRSILGAGVEVRIETSGMLRDRLESVVGLLRSRPGGGKVFLDIRHPSGWRVRAASRSIRVEPDDELLGGLRKILGEESVRLVAGG
jgi:DNA polymerase-3 subunit alpha